MNTTWRQCTIGDVCDTISNTYNSNAQQVVLINTSDVLEGKVLNHIYIPNENLKGQFKKTFEEGDILYSEIRPQNKRYAYIDFAPINYIASTKLMVIRNKNIVKSKYLYYFLQSDKIISELQMLAETRSGTFPQITFNELSKLSIKIPPLPEQDRIISILDSICKKIDINQQINDNLAPVHESKDTNKPEKSITFSSQPIRPSFSNKNISGRDILYPALRSTTIPYPDPYKRFFLAPRQHLFPHCIRIEYHVRKESVDRTTPVSPIKSGYQYRSIRSDTGKLKYRYSPASCPSNPIVRAFHNRKGLSSAMRFAHIPRYATIYSLSSRGVADCCRSIRVAKADRFRTDPIRSADFHNNITH